MKTNEDLESLSKKGPRGLSPRDRVEWHMHCDRLFEMYDSMPLGTTPRKCVGGGDEEGNALMFFIGTEEDSRRVAAFINAMEQ